MGEAAVCPEDAHGGAHVDGAAEAGPRVVAIGPMLMGQDKWYPPRLLFIGSHCPVHTEPKSTNGSAAAP